MRTLLFLILFSLLLACVSKTDTSETEDSVKHPVAVEDVTDIDSLIKVNAQKNLFLSFWSGMSRKDFYKVLNYELEKGSLINSDTSDFFRAKYAEYIINIKN